MTRNIFRITGELPPIINAVVKAGGIVLQTFRWCPGRTGSGADYYTDSLLSTLMWVQQLLRICMYYRTHLTIPKPFRLQNVRDR